MMNKDDEFIFPKGKELTENEFENLMHLIMDAFCYFNASTCGGTYRLTGKQNNAGIWKKATNLCFKYRIQPLQFVKLCFDNCRNQDSPMMQFMLSGYRMEELCKTYALKDKISDIDSYINDALEFASRLLECNKDDPMFVLKNPGYDIPAWTRIVLAPDNVKIKERFGLEFKEELNKNPELKIKLIERGFSLNEEDK